MHLRRVHKYTNTHIHVHNLFNNYTQVLIYSLNSVFEFMYFEFDEVRRETTAGRERPETLEEDEVNLARGSGEKHRKSQRNRLPEEMECRIWMDLRKN